MTTEPNTAQSIVDGQLAELQITNTNVPGTDYREIHEAKINALADEAAALPDITDKASLQVNQDVLTKLTRARTGIDKWRKAWKEPWKKIAEQVDTYLGTNRDSGLQAKIAAIEDGIEAKKKAYLDEQAKAQREADRLLEERYQGRVAKLIAAGMEQRADTLVIEHEGQTMSALLSQVRFATDEQMTTVVLKVYAIAAQKETAALAAQQAKEAEERERQEEAERLAQQKREQDEAGAKLKAEREALEKEREEMADHRAVARGADLVVLGATAHGYGPAAMRYEIGDVIVGHGELRHMDVETWIATRERVRDAKVKAEQEAAERAKAIEEQKAADKSEHYAHVATEHIAAETRKLDAALIDKLSTEAGRVEPEPVFETIAELTRPEPVPEFLRISDAQLQQMQDDQVIVQEGLEEQHDIHEAINDLSIFAEKKNWWVSGSGSLVFAGQHPAFSTMTVDEFAARALKVLAIEKA